MTDLTRREFAVTMLATAGSLLVPRSDEAASLLTESDFTLHSDVMVPMRDGVRLATDVYVPRAVTAGRRAARFPVILERTPYDKTAPSRSERTPSNAKPMGRAEVAEFFVRRGYAVIYQDVR